MVQPSLSPPAALRPLHRRLAECGLMLAALMASPAWSQGTSEPSEQVLAELVEDLPRLQLRLSDALSPPEPGSQAQAPTETEPPAAAPSSSAAMAAPARLTAPADLQSAALTAAPPPALKPMADETKTALPTSSPTGHAQPVTAAVATPLTAMPSPEVQVVRAATPAPSPGAALPAEALDPRGGLSLRYLLDQVALAHPSVQAARIDIRASAEDRRAQERQRWPSMSALVENKSTNPTIGATRVLRVEQTLWDAGRLSARINEANTTLNINQTRVYITVQQLSLQLIAAWQNLKSAEGRMAVAREALGRLAVYRGQMERRVQAEASPPIDLELMLSRILQTEVELNQASNARLQALTRIEQLASMSGLQQLPWAHSPLPDAALAHAQLDQLRDMDWLDVARRHPSVEKTRQESLIARQRLDGKRAELYPQLYLRVDRPVGTLNNDVAGFVGFRYTPGAGFATGVEAQALAERAASLEQATEVAVREISEAMASDRDELQSNRSRMQALEKAVEGSRSVLESYGRQFIAGRKTWLDLLNAVRELSQNQYALADSHAAMLAALYRLQVRIGETVQPAS